MLKYFRLVHLLCAGAMSGFLLIACSGESGSELAQLPPIGSDPPDDGTTPVNTPGSAGNNPALSGTLVTNRRDWLDSPLGGNSDLDVYNQPIEIGIPQGEVRNILSGKNPWRHPSGKTVYMIVCGIGFTERQAVIFDPADGVVRVISPCSEDFSNPGASDTIFDFAQLSPDQQKLAIEARYWLNDRWNVAAVVYNISDQQALGVWDQSASPTWLPNGQLLMSVGNAFRLVDDNMNELALLNMDNSTAQVRNPDVDPSGQRVVFEQNQELWIMNIDGTGQRALVTGNHRWEFPTWSPDGAKIAYLGRRLDAGFDHYDQAIYFVDPNDAQSSILDLRGNWPGDVTLVPSGPLSWVDQR